MSFKVAVIGGGAAGMMCAYLLNKAGHRVSVFEKQAILGGNIRTTNKNLKIDGLDEHLLLEGGVVEFSDRFHHFKKILEALGVKQVPVPIGTAIFTKDGKARLSGEAIRRNKAGLRKLGAYCQLLSLRAASFPLLLKSRKISTAELYNKSLEEVLPPAGTGSTWVKNFTMYSYSIPFKYIGNFPAELAVPVMRDFMMADWFRIPGGVYTYIEKILETFHGHIYCNADIRGVRRTTSGIRISQTGQEATFDKVVFATPPDQVLQLLSDPTPEEVRRFQHWKRNDAETIIHTDLSCYKKYNIKHPSEFDFFETENGWGYNASLNGLCGITGDIPYNLAYNMESLIDPDKIIHIQKHRTPFYEVRSFAFRNEIIATNGERQTYHAGAYLGDGLHEGAALSAVRVAGLVG